MDRLPQIAAAVIVAGAFAPLATAQVPPAPRSPAPAAPQVAPAVPRQPAQAGPSAPSPSSRPTYRRSVVHRRYLEYYPPGNEFQVERDPVRVARFDQGGGPNWDEQRAAQQVGIQRYNSIQQSIDSYAHPYGYGYGFGFGAFGGFN